MDHYCRRVVLGGSCLGSTGHDPLSRITHWESPGISPGRSHDSPRSNEPKAESWLHSSLQRFWYITRLYSSSDKDEGFLSRIGKAAKNLLPKNLFGNEEEKNKLARKKEYRDEVSGGLEAMLKDAPLGVRMMGKLITPLVSSLASNLADAMAEQQRTTEGIMDDARAYLKGDPSVSALLGEAIQLGAPFSQSTSSSSINGQTQTRVELAMPVQGSRGSGTVRLLATQDGIAQLQLDASGRRLDVKLTRRGSASSSFGRSSPSRINGDDNIIEAEVIEKDTK